VLSQTNENDATLIVLDVTEFGRVVLPFVWHNSKRFRNQPNGRDEFRLYISGLQHAGMPCPNPEDLVVLEPFKVSEENQFNDHFKFQVIRRNDSLYRELIQGASPRSNYWEISHDWVALTKQTKTEPNEQTDVPHRVASVDAVAEYLADEPLEAHDAPSEQVSVALDPNDVERFLGNTPAEVLAMRISGQTFREVVLASYSGRCAITGKALQVGGHLNVEAAHIQPRAHEGSNLPSNGIALSRDLHWGFDKGAFTLTEDLKVQVHPRLRDTDWQEFDGRPLQVPDHSFFRPSPESIQHHRTRVYGQFVHTGALRRLDEN
jgi:hypothetical protein